MAAFGLSVDLDCGNFGMAYGTYSQLDRSCMGLMWLILTTSGWQAWAACFTLMARISPRDSPWARRLVSGVLPLMIMGKPLPLDCTDTSCSTMDQVGTH